MASKIIPGNSESGTTQLSLVPRLSPQVTCKESQRTRPWTDCNLLLAGIIHKRLQLFTQWELSHYLKLSMQLSVWSWQKEYTCCKNAFHSSHTILCHFHYKISCMWLVHECSFYHKNGANFAMGVCTVCMLSLPIWQQIPNVQPSLD